MLRRQIIALQPLLKPVQGCLSTKAGRMVVPREAEQILRESAQGYPVIGVTGPRQSGKTTLTRMVFSDKPYVSLENPDTRERAETDPRGFLNTYRDGAIFDEAQRCPSLFSYLQGLVDADPVPGRFVLTGSQQFGLWPGITQSLAGRIALIRLLPFTWREWYGQRREDPPPGLDHALYTGFYPPVHDRRLRPALWYASYVQTYIERDVRQMLNIRDLSSFQRFVRLCSGRTGQLINLSDLAADAGITHNTAKAWLSVLEASYLIFFLPPHHRNFNKRLIKTPRLYFYDTGLAVWLLGIQNPDQLNLHPMRGALFESFVLSELFKTRYNRGASTPFYFWRDRSGQEVDLVIEHPAALQPVEIKSGQTLPPAAFSSLNRWMNLAGEAARDPMLIYGGDIPVTHGGVQALPWTDDAWRHLGEA